MVINGPNSRNTVAAFQQGEKINIAKPLLGIEAVAGGVLYFYS